MPGTGVPSLLKLKLGAPKAVDPVFEFLGEAKLAAVGAQRIVAIVAERLDGDLSGFGIGRLDFEIRRGRNYGRQ